MNLSDPTQDPSRVPFEESNSKFMGCIRRYNLPVTRGLSKNLFFGRAQPGKTVSQNLRGVPDRGELDWFPIKGTDACDHRNAEL
jgi:hypothetical protein